MADISHTGSVIAITASNTTAGVPIPLTSFPKDVDPIEVNDIDIADAEVGVNGDLVSWSTVNPIDVSVSVIPATLDHEILALIHSQNRVEKFKYNIKDKITLTRLCPNGEMVTWHNGRMVSGAGATSFQSSGRIKTVTYKFRFAKMTVTPPVIELLN